MLTTKQNIRRTEGFVAAELKLIPERQLLSLQFLVAVADSNPATSCAFISCVVGGGNLSRRVIERRDIIARAGD